MTTKSRILPTLKLSNLQYSKYCNITKHCLQFYFATNFVVVHYVVYSFCKYLAVFRNYITVKLLYSCNIKTCPKFYCLSKNSVWQLFPTYHFSIIGLYVTFILLIGRILRVSTTGQSTTISFRELPHVDNILRLCLDLYLVREMQEFRLEEDLYAKLIFVYRSAETRIKVTRMPMAEIIETKKNLQRRRSSSPIFTKYLNVQKFLNLICSKFHSAKKLELIINKMDSLLVYDKM